jgi:hypothetical protein
MNLKQLNKKLEQLEKQHKHRCLKEFRYYKKQAIEYLTKPLNENFTENDREYAYDRYMRYSEDAKHRKFSLSLKYYKRLGIFKIHNLDFNPVTYSGHSYNWYEITKRVKNVVLLNTYGYSMTTTKHVYKLKSLFNNLGIKYQEIDAPVGLQNLNLALEHHIDLLAQLLVKQKYARIKKSYNNSIKYQKSRIALLEKLGYKSNVDALNTAINAAELERSNKLLQKKRDRERDKLNKLVELQKQQVFSKEHLRLV